ncbi:MAG: hypothetical protein D8M58_04105 [Calditrichaeota bacterium]|nr:MAG: hypothetical protein DWQ03_02970 [Calditrichota bacterium]MBL1204552.1 hypothetical protein [Calditrichota bacterium]NOG44380.1 hypothetical protein [Calditrichota bacterium]
MTKYLQVYVLISAIILFNSCVVKPLLYHSEAELPYYSKTTLTNFELIIKEKKSSDYLKFGIICATDNNKTKYILIAPGNQNSSIRDMNNVRLDRSITLLKKQAQELLKSLEYSINNWSKNIPQLNGINIEYLVAPEQEIIQQSDNVVTWYPTLKFNYQNNSKGPLGIVILGEGFLKYYYELNSIGKLENFRDLLKIAITKI